MKNEKYRTFEKVKRKNGFLGLFKSGDFELQESNRMIKNVVEKLEMEYPDVHVEYEINNGRIYKARIEATSLKGEITYYSGGRNHSSDITTRIKVNNSRGYYDRIDRILKKI